MMKYLLIILLLFTSFSAFAQNDTTKYYTSTDYGWKWQRGMFKKAFILPSDTINNKLGVANIGARIYVGNGIFWIDITSVVHQVDTMNLSHRIDLKFNTSDSIGKWLSQGYLSVINGKINIVDTAAILLAYKNNINSLILDSIYQASQITAIQSVLNSKLNISDTIGKWLGIGYLTILNSKLNKVDTIYFLHSSDIANKMNYGDSSLMLHPYLNKKDTIYFLHSSDIANFATTSSVSSALNLKVNNSDSTIKYVTPSQLNSKGYITNIDSSVWQPKYRVDTMRANINLTLNGKVNKVDSGRLAAAWVTGGSLNKVRDSLQANINAKGTGTVTSITLGRGLTGGTITTSGTATLDTTQPYRWNSNVTASSAIARGMYWTPTLTAAANNDTLIGAYFKPSYYSIGSYTGVRKYAVGIYGGLYIKDSLDFDYNANNPLFYLNCNAVKLTGGTSPSFFQVQYLNTDIFSLNKNGGIITGLQATGTINAGAANGGTSASIQGTVGNTSSDALRTYSFSTANSPTTTLGASSLSTGAKGSAILNVVGWHGLLNTFTVSSPANASVLVSVDTLGNLSIAGKLKITTGSNASIGTATMNGTTGVTVSTTAVTSSSIILLTYQSCSNCGTPYIDTKTNLTSFVIKSTNASDASTIAYQIIN